MRWTRSHDRATVLFIFCSCCLSLNVLFTKIQRILEIKELERTSEREAQVASLIYYNSTYTGGDSSLYFLIHSDDGSIPSDTVCETRNATSLYWNKLRTIQLGLNEILFGICESAAEPSEVSVRVDDFHVIVQPLSLSSPHEDVVCLAYALLYEDRSTFNALLKYYSQRSDLMVVYVGSMTDEVYEETAAYRDILEIVPWPPFVDRPLPASDRLLLRAQSHRASQTAAFADCWLRYAPTSKRITMSDIDAIHFEPSCFSEAAGNTIFKHLYPSWAVTRLFIHRIVKNKYDEVSIDEQCYARSEVFDWNYDCQRTISGEKMNSTVETISLKKSGILSTVTNYQNDIKRCLQYKPSHEEKPTVMKLEFDLKKNRHGMNPCELRLRRESMKCRVAVNYSSVMFRERMKISVVKKRALLSFSHGCHL